MVYVLSQSKMREDEQALAQFVQGILNRKGYKVFIDTDSYREYLTEEATEADLWMLLATYLSEFSGAAVYDLAPNDIGINLACMLSAAGDDLGVPRTLEARVNAIGLPTVRDLAHVTGTRVQRQRAVWTEVKDRLSRTALVHQVVREGNFRLMLRDFAIANRWACIFTAENEEERAFRAEVLAWLEPNAPVYGWNDNEIPFIEDISRAGKFAIPTDWSCNHSYFGVSPHKLRQRTRRAPVAENKHYVAIVVSDGDNVQWLERDFATEGIFGQRQRSRSDYKMNWTFSPSLQQLCPAAAERIYGGVKMDYFISGVSGVGYANCLSYPREHLDGFAALTARAMADSDQKVLCMLDNVYLTEDRKLVSDRLAAFTRYENIAGGIWELDPDHYRGGRGKIFWSDNKPFISVRYSLWHPSDKPGRATKEFLDAFIDKINARQVAPDSEEGYTVINVHPWTIDMGALDYVVAGLGEHIELVYADELIELVKRNLGKFRRTVKIMDVAERAQVAKSTVSNVLSGKRFVSEEIRKKVLEACKELNFHPNFYASGLSSRKANIVALILESNEDLERTFYSKLIIACLREAAERGYSLLVYYHPDGAKLAEKLRHGRAPIDGAVLMAPCIDDERLKQIEHDSISCVVIGHIDENLEFRSVDIDNVALVEEVGRTLAPRYKTVYLINSDRRLTISRDRESGFSKVCAEAGIDPAAHVFESKNSSEEEGYAIAQKVMARDTLFITANEHIAAGVYRAAAEAGLRIGCDVGVFSLGRSMQHGSFTPALSYAEQDYAVIGRTATGMLIDEIEDDGGRRNVLLHSDPVYTQSVEREERP